MLGARHTAGPSRKGFFVPLLKGIEILLALSKEGVVLFNCRRQLGLHVIVRLYGSVILEVDVIDVRCPFPSIGN